MRASISVTMALVPDVWSFGAMGMFPSERLRGSVRRSVASHIRQSAVPFPALRRLIGVPRLARTAAFYVLLTVLSLVFALPLFWMLSTALKNDVQTYHVPPIWLPWPPRLSNFPEALHAQPFGLYFLNSLQYSATAIIGQLLSCSLAAYGFARLRWKGRDALFAICIATMMIPYQVTMVPLFIIFRHLGWINSYRPLLVPAFFGSAYFIFLLRQFFMTVPQDLTEAARIDGSSELGILVRIIVPLARPVLVVVALLELLFTWDNYLGPLIYLDDQRLFPVAIGLQLFQSQFVEKLAWPYLMAATSTVILPIVILFFFAQRTFVEGVAISGIRG